MSLQPSMVLEILCRKSSTGVLWHEAFESTLNDADDEAFLYAWIVALAHEYGRYGYRRNTALLHQEGWPNNYGLVKFTGEETTVKTSTWERGIGIGIGAFAVLAVVAPPLWAFDTFEHRHLGNVAYEQAKRAVKGNLPQQVMDDLRKFEKELEVRETPCIPSSQIKPSQCMAIKALRRIPVRFGDFAALAGDHAGTPAEVYEMVQNFVQVGKHSEEVTRVLATRRQWERACAQMRRYYSDGGELDGVHCVKDGGPSHRVPMPFCHSQGIVLNAMSGARSKGSLDSLISYRQTKVTFRPIRGVSTRFVITRHFRPPNLTRTRRPTKRGVGTSSPYSGSRRSNIIMAKMRPYATCGVHWSMKDMPSIFSTIPLPPAISAPSSATV